MCCDRIIDQLNKIDSLTYTFNSDAKKSYECYINIYRNNKDAESACKLEILDRILRYQILLNLEGQLYKNYLEDYFDNIQQPIDTLKYFLHRHKALIQDYFHEGKLEQLEINNWSKLINKSWSLKDTILGLEFHALYANFLDSAKNNLEEAKKQYLIILNILSSSNSSDFNRYLFSTLANLGKLYEIEGYSEEAIRLYKQSLQTDSPTRVTFNVIRLYEWITDCYKELGQYDSAYHYMQLTHQTLVDSEKRKHDVAISELEEKYQNEQLSSQVLEQNLALQKNTTHLIAIGAIASLLGIGWFLYRQRSRSQLENKEKQAQLDAINARLDGEQEERKRVASALHDEISSHLSAAAIHLTMLQSSNMESSTKAQQLISEASQRTRQLSHELYPPVLLQQGLVAALSSFSQQVKSEHLDLQFSATEQSSQLSHEVEAKIYYTIIELIQNIIKHSEASKANITTATDEDSLKIVIEDNGIGFNPDTTSQGLGLSSVKARIEDLNGQITIISQPNQGTRIDVSIPLAA